MLKCSECGKDMPNAEGMSWAMLPKMTCRVCSGIKNDAPVDINAGRPHQAIGMPGYGVQSYGRRATKCSTSVE